MNKLPWFSHDHDSHKDQNLRRAIREQGHAAHTIYWTLLECLHWHGKGDRLIMSISDFANDSMSTTLKVRVVLTLLGRMGMIQGNWSGDYLEIEIKKFRERQSKLKSNLPSTFRQPSVNLPLYIEEEGEEDNNRLKTTAQSADPPNPEIKVPKPHTPIQLVMRAYKEAKGIPLDDKVWDKQNFRVWAKAAKKILEAFNGDDKKAVFYILNKGYDWEEVNFTWNLATLARHACDDRGKNEIHAGADRGGSADHDSQLEPLSQPVGSDRPVGRRGSPRIAGVGEIAGETIRQIANKRPGGADGQNKHEEWDDPFLGPHS